LAGTPNTLKKVLVKNFTIMQVSARFGREQRSEAMNSGVGGVFCK
jgi:hypothetical protein